MPGQLPSLRAVILSSSSSRRHLMRLVSCARAAGVIPEIVRSVERAAERIRDLPLAAVVFDATPLFEPDGDAGAHIAAEVARVGVRCRDAEVIVVAVQPTAKLVAACFRADAIDVVNLADRPEQALRAAVSRAGARRSARLRRRSESREIRRVLDEFLRDLVKTERRSLELEGRLAALGRPARSDPPTPPDRQPVVLVVDRDRRLAGALADRLERGGVITYALVDGEKAIAEALRLARQGAPIDLAVVDAALPGMNGLEVIRCLREIHERLPVLLTAAATGARARRADLGVCECLHKPFDDVNAVVARIRSQAIRAMAEDRDRFYLGRIKQRHEAVFSRYLRLLGGHAARK